jgi:acyl dehydratase
MSPIEVGTAVPELVQEADLRSAVRYAGASGDLNPLHFDPEFAARVSPTGGIIVHGMYAMGAVSRALTTFAGGPEQVIGLEIRFTRPWPLGSSATFGGEVTAVEDGVATVALWGKTDDDTRILRGTGRIRV